MLLQLVITLPPLKLLDGLVANNAEKIIAEVPLLIRIIMIERQLLDEGNQRLVDDLVRIDRREVLAEESVNQQSVLVGKLRPPWRHGILAQHLDQRF